MLAARLRGLRDGTLLSSVLSVWQDRRGRRQVRCLPAAHAPCAPQPTSLDHPPTRPHTRPPPSGRMPPWPPRARPTLFDPATRPFDLAQARHRRFQRARRRRRGPRGSGRCSSGQGGVRGGRWCAARRLGDASEAASSTAKMASFSEVSFFYERCAEIVGGSRTQ